MLWTIPGVNGNYAPPVVFPPTVHTVSWAQIESTILDTQHTVAESLIEPSRGTLSQHLFTHIGMLIAPRVAYWYNQNAAAAQWYADLLLTISSEAHTINNYEGPVLAVLFVVSITTRKSISC